MTNLFICTFEGCGQSFDTKNKKDSHFKLHQTTTLVGGVELVKTNGFFKCPVQKCDKSFEKSSSIHRHFVEKHRETDKTSFRLNGVFVEKVNGFYGCPSCDRKYDKASCLRVHYSQYHVNREWITVCGLKISKVNNKYKCPKCLEHYSTVKHIQNHFWHKHYLNDKNSNQSNEDPGSGPESVDYSIDDETFANIDQDDEYSNKYGKSFDGRNKDDESFANYNQKNKYLAKPKHYSENEYFTEPEIEFSKTKHYPSLLDLDEILFNDSDALARWKQGLPCMILNLK
jgi:hypothetical protein